MRRTRNLSSWLVALTCALPLIPATSARAQAQESVSPTGAAAPAISSDELDSLVAPIALYPDPLLAQVLAASTYPLEIVQLQQWLAQHPDLKDQALVDAVQQQNWDPSIQGLAALPDVVKVLAGDIRWTTDLGNAFLAQQSDVMGAVQRMRAKAKGAGTLKSSPQMKVETEVVEGQSVVVIEQADPKVVYVPSYDPVVVYGAPAPAYPYPRPTPSRGMALSFGVGMVMGAAFSGRLGLQLGLGRRRQQQRQHQQQQQLRKKLQRRKGAAAAARAAVEGEAGSTIPSTAVGRPTATGERPTDSAAGRAGAPRRASGPGRRRSSGTGRRGAAAGRWRVARRRQPTIRGARGGGAGAEGAAAERRRRRSRRQPQRVGRG